MPLNIEVENDLISPLLPEKKYSNDESALGDSNAKSFWETLNYPTQHVIGMFILFFFSTFFWFILHVIKVDHIEYFELPLSQWVILLSLVILSYLVISLVVNLVLDLWLYIKHEKYGYYLRLSHLNHKMIVCFFFFFSCLILYDLFFTVACYESTYNDGSANSTILDEDEMAKKNKDSASHGRADANHTFKPRSNIYSYTSHSQCDLLVIRKLLICALLTTLGFAVVKWLVLIVSVKYQEQVYSDRIITNKFQLYVSGLLYEACKEEGSKRKIKLEERRSSFYNSLGSNENFNSDDEDDTHSYHGGMASHGLPGRRGYGKSISRLPSFIGKLCKIFVKTSPKPEVPRYSFQGEDSSPSFSNKSPVKLYYLVNFNRFKKKVNVFKSDFTISQNYKENISPEEVQNRARYVYDILRSMSTSDSDYIVLEDFQKIFKVNSSALEAYHIFDVNFDGKISRSELKHTFANIYKEHYNLTQSVHSSANALNALDSILSAGLVSILFALYLFVFGFSLQYIVTFSFSLIVGLNAVIGPTLKNICGSLVFLFRDHLYDVGDRIRIENDPRIYTVKNVSISRTEVHDLKGDLVTFSNETLAQKTITNLRRSKEQWEIIDICFDVKTSEEQLNKLRSDLTVFLSAHPQYFFQKFDMEHFDQDNHIDVLPTRIRIPCKQSQDNMKNTERHRCLASYLRSEMETLNIEYHIRGGPMGLKSIKPSGAVAQKPV